MKFNLKNALFLFVLLLLLVGLSACVRRSPSAPANNNAGGAPAITTGAEGAPTQAVEDILAQIPTQTALAATLQAQMGGPAPTPDAAAGAATAIAPLPTGDVLPPPGGLTPVAPPADIQPSPIPPTAAPVIVAPTATPGLPARYVLQSGEHPYCIARRFNINPGDLLNANGLGSNSRPGAGYQLTIPQNAGTFPGERALRSHPTTYTVGAGETLNSIACLFGDVDPETIAFVNSLTSNKLTPGQVLQIP